MSGKASKQVVKLDPRIPVPKFRQQASSWVNTKKAKKLSEQTTTRTKQAAAILIIAMLLVAQAEPLINKSARPKTRNSKPKGVIIPQQQSASVFTPKQITYVVNQQAAPLPKAKKNSPPTLIDPTVDNTLNRAGKLNKQEIQFEKEAITRLKHTVVQMSNNHDGEAALQIYQEGETKVNQNASEINLAIERHQDNLAEKYRSQRNLKWLAAFYIRQENYELALRYLQLLQSRLPYDDVLRNLLARFITLRPAAELQHNVKLLIVNNQILIDILQYFSDDHSAYFGNEDAADNYNLPQLVKRQEEQIQYFLRLDDYTKASHFLKKLPPSVEVYKQQATLAIKLRNFTEALGYIDRALKQAVIPGLQEQRNVIMALQDIENLLPDYENIEKIIHVLMSAITTENDTAVQEWIKDLLAYFNVYAGILLEETSVSLSYAEKAKSHYQKAMELCPFWTMPQFRLARLMQNQGQFVVAQSYYHQAQKQNPSVQEISYIAREVAYQMDVSNTVNALIKRIQKEDLGLLDIVYRLAPPEKFDDLDFKISDLVEAKKNLVNRLIALNRYESDKVDKLFIVLLDYNKNIEKFIAAMRQFDNQANLLRVEAANILRNNALLLLNKALEILNSIDGISTDPSFNSYYLLIYNQMGVLGTEERLLMMLSKENMAAVKIALLVTIYYDPLPAIYDHYSYIAGPVESFLCARRVHELMPDDIARRGDYIFQLNRLQKDISKAGVYELIRHTGTVLYAAEVKAAERCYRRGDNDQAKMFLYAALWELEAYPESAKAELFREYASELLVAVERKLATQKSEDNDNPMHAKPEQYYRKIVTKIPKNTRDPLAFQRELVSYFELIEVYYLNEFFIGLLEILLKDLYLGKYTETDNWITLDLVNFVDTFELKVREFGFNRYNDNVTTTIDFDKKDLVALVVKQLEQLNSDCCQVEHQYDVITNTLKIRFIVNDFLVGEADPEVANHAIKQQLFSQSLQYKQLCEAEEKVELEEAIAKLKTDIFSLYGVVKEQYQDAKNQQQQLEGIRQYLESSSDLAQLIKKAEEEKRVEEVKDHQSLANLVDKIKRLIGYLACLQDEKSRGVFTFDRLAIPSYSFSSLIESLEQLATVFCTAVAEVNANIDLMRELDLERFYHELMLRQAEKNHLVSLSRNYFNLIFEAYTKIRKIISVIYSAEKAMPVLSVIERGEKTKREQQELQRWVEYVEQLAQKRKRQEFLQREHIRKLTVAEAMQQAEQQRQVRLDLENKLLQDRLGSIKPELILQQLDMLEKVQHRNSEQTVMSDVLKGIILKNELLFHGYYLVLLIRPLQPDIMSIFKNILMNRYDLIELTVLQDFLEYLDEYLKDSLRNLCSNPSIKTLNIVNQAIEKLNSTALIKIKQNDKLDFSADLEKFSKVLMNWHNIIEGNLSEIPQATYIMLYLQLGQCFKIIFEYRYDLENLQFRHYEERFESEYQEEKDLRTFVNLCYGLRKEVSHGEVIPNLITTEQTTNIIKQLQDKNLCNKFITMVGNLKNKISAVTPRVYLA